MTIEPNFNIVLFQPKIPQNTGNIGRLAAGTNCKLHIIGPTPFEITDKNVKRAGLDYWPHLNHQIYTSIDEFLNFHPSFFQRTWALTTKSDLPYTEASFKKKEYLLFGSETQGLPEEIHQKLAGKRLKIPILNENIRSFNLANSVSIVLFEGLRQINIHSKKSCSI